MRICSRRREAGLVEKRRSWRRFSTILPARRLGLERVRARARPTLFRRFGRDSRGRRSLDSSVPASALSSSDRVRGPGLRAEYFNNRELQGKPVVVRTDAQVNFDFGTLSPAAGLAPKDFSVRWTGKLNRQILCRV